MRACIPDAIRTLLSILRKHKEKLLTNLSQICCVCIAYIFIVITSGFNNGYFEVFFVVVAIIIILFSYILLHISFVSYKNILFIVQ